MDIEEVRLRIVESAMRYIAGTGVDGVIQISQKLEDYIFNSDKGSLPPDDVGKDQRSRLRLKAKDKPSNN
jgi:hypothetical protein